MADFHAINYKGKIIFCLDIAGLNSRDKIDFYKYINQAKEEFQKHPPKSLLVVTNVTNTRYDTEIAKIFTDYVKHNTPYVKASAVVGLSGLQKIILTIIKTATGRDFYLAASMEEALEWLVGQ